MPKQTFVILGPDDDDGIPQHWDREFWQWMEGAGGDSPSPSCIYQREELQPILTHEYPVGAVGVTCLETGGGINFPPYGMGYDRKQRQLWKARQDEFWRNKI